MSDSAAAYRSGSARFGTFGGVFTPNVLTILGVIMFLRLGQVVGQAGIADAIVIVLCAKLITSLTAVSLAGVATNTRVKGGGAYFLISRSLGPEFGGDRHRVLSGAGIFGRDVRRCLHDVRAVFPVAEMCKRSRKAAVVFVGFDPPNEGSAQIFAKNYYRVMEHLDTVILVHSAEDMDLDA